MEQITEKDVYTSTMIKDYGTYYKVIYFKTSVRKSGFESDDEFYCSKSKKENISLEEREILDKENEERSIRRSKDKVQAIANLNDWSYFVTLTFDELKVGDRTDSKALKKKTLQYFKDLSRKYNIKYLLIPEYHKDNKCVHWHGLIYDSQERLKLTDSGLKTKFGNKIYNIDSWQRYKGFSTCCKIPDDNNDKIAISRYISKYINKNDVRIYDKYYYCSNALINNPKVRYDVDLPIDFFEDCYECESCYIKTYNK